MDQGIAGLAGAIAGGLIGIVGTLGAAQLTGRDQKRAQHDEWRRQVRRDAYSQFITRASRALAAGNAAHTAARANQLDAGAYTALADAAREVEEALALVLLEGPEEAGIAADEVNSEVQGWKFAIGWLTGVSEFQVPREEAISRSADASNFGADRLHNFTELCRGLLDVQ